MCFKQNDTTIYPNSNVSCELINEIDNPPTKSVRAVIIPNPLLSESILIVESAAILSGITFRLYNSEGQLIREEKIESFSTVIRKGNLSDGIYLYKVIKNGETVAGGKLLVQ